MESFSRGWNFLTQAWKMAFADKDLLKPSIYALFAGFIVSLVGALPIGVAVFLFQDGGTFGQVLIALVSAVFIFLQYAVSYIFSAMTVYLIYGYLSEGDGKMEKAWEIVKRDWLDILGLAAASTLVNLAKGFIKGKGKSGVRTFLAEALDRIWTQATYLVLPAMVIEDINLPEGLQRATYIAKNNLLLIGVSMVGVGAVTGLLNFALGLIGILLGVGVAFPFISASGGSLVLIVLGVLAGLLVASLFFMTASVVSSYTATAYHTCLYLWACDVEKAPNPAQVMAPGPLAAVLGR
jgi:hypothetical protein